MGQITPLDKKEVSRQMYKRREHILAAVTAIFLAMCLCLLGCGGSGGNNSPQMSSAQAAPSAEPAAPAPEESYDYDYGKDTSQIVIDGSDGEAGGAPQFDLPDTRKVIRHANMELETKEFDPALSGILQAVANAGGYIESQDQGGGSSYGSGRYREFPDLIWHRRGDGAVVRGEQELVAVVDGEPVRGKELVIRLSDKKVNFFYPAGCGYSTK